MEKRHFAGHKQLEANGARRVRKPGGEDSRERETEKEASVFIRRKEKAGVRTAGTEGHPW